MTVLNDTNDFYGLTKLKDLRLPKSTSSLAGKPYSLTSLELLDAGVTTTFGQSMMEQRRELMAERHTLPSRYWEPQPDEEDLKRLEEEYRKFSIRKSPES